MGACGSGEDRKKNKYKEDKKDNDLDKKEENNKKKNENNIEKKEENSHENNILFQEDIKEIKEEEIAKLTNIPKNFMGTKYHYKLEDLTKKNIFENEIESEKKIGDLINDLKLKANADFIIEFDNNMKIGYDKINKTFNDILIEIFNKNIPETINMKYSYKGLDIPESKNEIIEAYIESNKIIGSVILDNPELFCIITYEKDMKLIKPYYYKRKDNEELIKFNSFTAFCNGKDKLYFSGGENEQTYDADRTILKYNDFFYIDLTNLKENENKIEIKELPNLNESRTWHSMIYIPYKYIFIVGGSNTKSVEIYDMETNEIEKDSELNEFRSECTLCLVNNIYLYAFWGFLLHQEYNISIERCNLLKEERKWDYVYINEKSVPNIRLSFFAISYFNDDKILLIGGNDNGDEKRYDYIYKIGNNDEEKDEIEEYKCNIDENNSVFKDKLFMPVEEDKSVNIPLIIGDDIKMYIIDTNNGEITVKNYEEIIQ